MKKGNGYSIDEIFRDLRSKDPMTYEDAYHALLPQVSVHKDRIIAALSEESDSKIKNRYIELLGDCRDPSLIPIIVKELDSEVEEVIPWAIGALEKIGTQDALAVVNRFKSARPEWN